jgi:signal transduction histidine kinase
MKKPIQPANSWESLAALAGELAHEIKNPLSTIKLNLQLLEEDWADPKTPREKRTARKLQVLQKEVQRLTQTLEDFLRFIRVGALSLQPTDVNELIAEIAEFVEPELARTSVGLREQYFPDLPRCLADPKILKQAILNVILNAQQAMPQGGELILRTSRTGENGEFVAVDIIDTGSGIPENVKDKIFDVFFSTKKEGSGLGLAVTRRIVEQHGGTITFQSEPGKGTNFTIRIPACMCTDRPDDTRS